MTNDVLPVALLEAWMRRFYFDVDIDIGSSGVTDFSLRELRALLDLGHDELDAVTFHDSRTLGGDRLRAAIAARWAGGETACVMATHGSTEANFLAMTALLRAGDEVLVLDPSYQQLFALAQAIGCRLRRWPLRFARQFAPDLEEAKTLITPRTRMIVVNFPHNPTGATLSRAEQDELIAGAARVGAYLVWDAAFAVLTYDAPPLPDPVASYERAISFGTLSKAYGLPGLRVGWCLAAPAVLERMIGVRDYVTLHLSPLVELIASRAIERADLLAGLRLAQARQNLAALSAWMAQHREDVDWVPPRGGVSAFPRLRRTPDVTRLCERLAVEERVLLVPGACFGHPCHARLGFGGPAEQLQQGLSRLSRLLTGSGAAVATAEPEGRTPRDHQHHERLLQT